MGRQLAREHKIQADVIVPVPDSGNCAALGYSLESGIPFEMAFVRNHYVGRSFLQPSQFIRDFNVRVKLNLIADLVRGKSVVIVDDSIVRGTTSKARVTSLKEAGAKEVHVLVSCPPHINPCVYGIDFPERSKLMAAPNTHDEIRRFLNADSLGYLSLDGMVAATGRPKNAFCEISPLKIGVIQLHHGEVTTSEIKSSGVDPGEERNGLTICKLYFICPICIYGAAFGFIFDVFFLHFHFLLVGPLT